MNKMFNMGNTNNTLTSSMMRSEFDKRKVDALQKTCHEQESLPRQSENLMN